MAYHSFWCITGVCLVGDFGEEDVNLVRRIKEVDLPKAVILGNHDAWYDAFLLKVLWAYKP